MTLKQQLIEEIEEIPESLVSQLLDYVLFIKARYVEEDITLEEKMSISQSLKDYEAGDYLTLEEYEANQQ